MKTTNIHIAKSILITGCVISILSLIGCSKNNPLSPNCLNVSWIKNVEKELNV